MRNSLFPMVRQQADSYRRGFLARGAEWLPDLLKKHIPIQGPPNRPREKPFIHNCLIVNMETWNKLLKRFPVSRISENF